MNLYFVSLLDQHRKRRNEFAVEYTIYNNGNIRPTEYYSDYLLTRFPYIKKGDLISVIDNNRDSLYGHWFWGLDVPSISTSYEFPFYKNIEMLKYTDWSFISWDTRKKISSSRLQNKGSFFQIDRFKLGNRRYTLKFEPGNYSKSTLRKKIKNCTTTIFYPVFNENVRERKNVLTLSLKY